MRIGPMRTSPKKLANRANPASSKVEFDWSILPAPLPRQQPIGSVTVREYAARYNLSASSAYRELCALVASGRLTRVEFISGHGRAAAYLRSK